MQILSTKKNSFINYLYLLKPRETSLLAFIGLCTALIASNGYLNAPRLVLATLAILIGSAGCNGLTNYLDREVDAQMARTKNRVLPLGLIAPPEKALALVIMLIVVALFLAWTLSPICFFVGLIGAVASSVWRKTASCTFLGIVAGCSPVLIAWFAFNNNFDIRILLLCLLIVFWIPIHVWNVMLAKRQEYVDAGLNYLPLNLDIKHTVRILLFLTIMLYLTSDAIYFFNGLHLPYLIIANILGIFMIIAIAAVLSKMDSKSFWRLYKLSSFPYLGIIFLVMCLDVLILH